MSVGYSWRGKGACSGWEGGGLGGVGFEGGGEWGGGCGFGFGNGLLVRFKKGFFNGVPSFRCARYSPLASWNARSNCGMPVHFNNRIEVSGQPNNIVVLRTYATTRS